jgi:aminoglycoside 3-N-acetyltransferase
MLRRLIKRVLPSQTLIFLKKHLRSRRRAQIMGLPPLTPDKFRWILTEKLGLTTGDVVFIHSSIDRLNLTFPFQQVLKILQETVGSEGSLLFPTYPRLASYEFLSRGETFDVRKSPSFTGILTEFARRQPNACRSIHPTKSVCALGPKAEKLTKDHGQSPYPYDQCSPYYKMVPANGKLIGIGVQTSSLSFVHSVDDYLKDDFPIAPYHDRLFQSKCIDYAGHPIIIETYAHNIDKMIFNLPQFMSRYISPEICLDMIIEGTPYFRAQASLLFERMLGLARDNITIYSRKLYKTNNK